MFVKRAGGFPNQADSAPLSTYVDVQTHMYNTHTNTITKVNVRSWDGCPGPWSRFAPPPALGGGQITVTIAR